MGSPPGYPSEPPLGDVDRPPLIPGATLPPVPNRTPVPPGRNRWVVLGVLATVALVAAAMLGVVLVADDDPTDQASPGPTAPSNEQPSVGSEHDTSGTPTEAEVEDLVAELGDFVEQQRG